MKPLGMRSYGHITHLPGSRIGPGDHKCNAGQTRLATEKLRDRFDRVIVQEKLDGSNVGIARLDGKILALTRSGYLATTSRYPQHQIFASWVRENTDRLLAVLSDGERLCGEWLMQAHGTRYDLKHEPLVVFDLMRSHSRVTYEELIERISGKFIIPHTIHCGGSLTIDEAMKLLGKHGFHGAIDPVEGAVWRVERNKSIKSNSNQNERHWKVSFLAKYVRSDKIDGIYLPEISGQPPIFNWQPKSIST